MIWGASLLVHGALAVGITVVAYRTQELDEIAEEEAAREEESERALAPEHEDEEAAAR